MQLLPLPVSAALALAACLPAAPAWAELKLGTLFGPGMVVQADRPVPVFGTDEPGTPVTVAVRGAGVEADVEAEADEEGVWRVRLPALEAPGPYSVVVSTDDETVELEDVLAGDVWLCSGQSNMGWPVSKSRDGGRAAAASEDGQLRLLKVPLRGSPTPVDRLDVGWQAAGPATVGDFSAVGYYFGRALRRETGRPIGLVQSAWGGSKIRAWLPDGQIEASGRGDQIRGESRRQRRDYERRLAAWRDGGKKGPRPKPLGGGPNHRPAWLYNAMIHPLGDVPLAGVIWYQGESDAYQPEPYARLFDLLVGSYRGQFADGRDDVSLPVYFVQLPNFKHKNGNLWRAFRERQRQTAAPDGDGVDMAVTIDVGDPDDIHPADKRPVGERLARLALRDVYGQDVLADSPEPTAVVRQGAAVRVSLDAAGAGLSTVDDRPPQGFVLVDADGTTAEAEAEVVAPDAVLLRAATVSAPVEVRYAWEADPDVNLVNAAGLPVTPFVEPVDGSPTE